MLPRDRNPYTPGAGQNPPVLSGRSHELATFETTLTRLGNGRSARCQLVVGLRGVGKTVLLNQFARRATQRGWVVVEHELRPSGDLFSTVTRMVRDALVAIAPPSAWDAAARRLGSLLSGIGASYSIAGLTVRVAPGGQDDPALSMDVTRDLTDLLLALGEAARQHERGVVLLFDELQFAATEPLGALVTALHKVAQRELPVTMVAAGLPQTRGVLAEAASCSERMFALAESGAPEVASRDVAELLGLRSSTQAGQTRDALIRG